MDSPMHAAHMAVHFAPGAPVTIRAFHIGAHDEYVVTFTDDARLYFQTLEDMERFAGDLLAFVASQRRPQAGAA
ncbi:MAG TPA: hypothetical protein VF192_12205 [Longimicrobiales bacterium]